MRSLLALLAALMLVLSVAPVAGHWDIEQDPSKWGQLPDLSTNGIDINATQDYILADDFLCEEEGLITGIHVWASWYHDEYPNDPGAVSFTLSIHEDIPDSISSTGYSMPGEVLWEMSFDPGEFTVQLWAEQIQEGWMDPPESYEFPADWTCWQYNFDIPKALAFLQEGTYQLPKVYWLDVQAVPAEPGFDFGWKTTDYNWNDDAVYGIGQEPYAGPWYEMVYPPGHQLEGQSLGLAFVIQTTDPDPVLDWGDAPNSSMGYSYPTVSAENGPSHDFTNGHGLGYNWGGEPDGQPDPNALGDDNDGFDDEDGVVFTTPLIPGTPARVDITATDPDGGGVYIDAWVDFGADGSWAEPGDQIWNAKWVPTWTSTQYFNVPSTAVPNAVTFARFRSSDAGGLPYTGYGGSGEVEDYEVTISPPEDFKWVQEPHLSCMGIDVNATSPFILADDFECTQTGRIDEIRVWGSWKYDLYLGGPEYVDFVLSIHEDIPDSLSPTGHSMPGKLLWSRLFEGGTLYGFDWEPYYAGVSEGWMDPPDFFEFPADTVCWLYTFYPPPEDHLYQVGTPENPKVYWLNVQAFPHAPIAYFGWKTTTDNWNDDAVWGTGEEPYDGPWEELIYPVEHGWHPESIDLAFGIFGSPTTDVPGGEIPSAFGLKQNVPNPFNPVTEIAYEIPAGGAEIRVEVFDVAGRRVATLVDGFEPDGTRCVTWNGRDDAGRRLPSGVYFYRLVGSDFEAVEKMLLLK